MPRTKTNNRRTRDQKLEGGRFMSERGCHWVLIPFATGWIAAQRLLPQAGAAVVAELRIYPDETPPVLDGVQEARVIHPGEWSQSAESVPAGGLSTPIVRRAPVGRHAAEPVARDWLEAVLFAKEDRAGVGVLYPPETREQARRIADYLSIRPSGPTPEPKSQRGRKPRPRTFYEAVAADYRRWSGQDPAKRISNKHRVSRATARTWIYTARHTFGLLPGTEPGKGSRFGESPVKRRGR